MKKGKAKPFPAHKKEGRCPHCGSAVIFKVISRTRSFEDHENAAVMQRTKKGEAVVRFFSLWRHFDKPCSLPRTGYYENGRLFLSPKGEITGEYKYGHSASMGRYGWYPVKDQLAGRKEEMRYEQDPVLWNGRRWQRFPDRAGASESDRYGWEGCAACGMFLQTRGK